MSCSRSITNLTCFFAPLLAACGPSSRVTPTASSQDGGSSLDASAGVVSQDNDGSSTADEAGASFADDAGTATPNSHGTLATPAAAFLDTIGICTHIGQGVDDPTKVATALAFAGARKIRDDGHPEHVQDWINVHNATGVKLSLLTDQDVQSTVDMAKQLNAASALLAVEGPNEPNNFPVTYGGVTSSSSSTFVPVANLQRDLYAAVHAEPTLSGVPVFHSSEAGGSEPDDVGLQFLRIPGDAGTTMPSGTAYADFANTHNYICGHQSKLVDNTAWMAEDPTLNADWDGMNVEYGTTWNKRFAGNPVGELPAIPRVTTETGWVTTGNGAITQEQQGRLFLNLYLSAFKRGWSYTFVYMLRDEPGQGDWGFFDASYAPKSSGTYLHNFTSILADSGASSAATDRLAYAIPNEPSTVHDLLLETSSGTFDLVVWDEHPAGGSDAVTVNLETAANVTLFDPTTGTDATGTMSGATSVPLMLTDHPVIVQLR